MALKKYFPDVRMGGNKVSSDEIDAVVPYTIAYPSIGTATVWAGKGTGAVAAVGTIQNATMDYPRNLYVEIAGAAVGMGGTATIYGKDQFGVSQSEAIGFGSASGGGSAVGSLIFASVSTVSVTTATGDGTAVGSVGIGYAKGTSATMKAMFGLPVRIGAYTEVKRLTWVNNGAVTAINGGTIGTAQTAGYVNTTNHSFMGTQIVAATDIYSLSILPSYNSETVSNIA